MLLRHSLAINVSCQGGAITCDEQAPYYGTRGLSDTLPEAEGKRQAPTQRPTGDVMLHLLILAQVSKTTIVPHTTSPTPHWTSIFEALVKYWLRAIVAAVYRAVTMRLWTVSTSPSYCPPSHGHAGPLVNSHTT